jgi:hypothetical protein
LLLYSIFNNSPKFHDLLPQKNIRLRLDRSFGLRERERGTNHQILS